MVLDDDSLNNADLENLKMMQDSSGPSPLKVAAWQCYFVRRSTIKCRQLDAPLAAREHIVFALDGDDSIFETDLPFVFHSRDLFRPPR